jgi:RHS repeat-associated protein
MTKKTVAGQVTSYIYNTEDRLAEVWNGAVGSGSLISQYYYDPFGRRLWKEVNGVRTYFVYADEGLVAEVDELGNVNKSYGYRPGSTWTTDPLFMKVGGEYYFYQNDHLGTPQKMTAVNGAVVWSAKYSSFGEATVDLSSTITNNLRFPGQYYDEETSLNYNYHRYYDVKTGRYLTPDPIGFKGGDINLFGYVLGNPINISDSRALCVPVWVYTAAAWVIRDLSSPHPGAIQSIIIIVGGVSYEVKELYHARGNNLQDLAKHNRKMVTLARDLCYSTCTDDYNCPKCTDQQATWIECNRKCSDNFLSGIETYVWPYEDIISRDY